METTHTTDAGLACVSVTGCWIRGLLASKKFWLSFVGALITIGVWQWILQTQVMMNDYRDTSIMWRPYHEMKPSLFYIAYAIKAFAFTYLILASMRTSRWCDAIAAGGKLGLISVAVAVIAWNTMPFATMTIPVKWAIGGFVEAILVAIVVKLVNSCVCKMCHKKVVPTA